jgi:hypothetical protein
MHRGHSIFIQAIKDKKKVLIEQLTDADRNLRTRVCRPLFYIPADRQDNCAHYYFWDDTGGGNGDLFWVTPGQIVSMKLTQEPFDPTGFALVSGEDIPPEDSQSPGS